VNKKRLFQNLDALECFVGKLLLPLQAEQQKIAAVTTAEGDAKAAEMIASAVGKTNYQLICRPVGRHSLRGQKPLPCEMFVNVKASRCF